MKKVRIWMLAVPTILLMVMGFSFCWETPVDGCCYGPGSHHFFAHMVRWTTIGFSLAVLAYILGWRRWLRVTPYIGLGWVALVVCSAMSPMVTGHWGWTDIGCCRINVLEFAPIVLSLFVAYLIRVFNYKAFATVGMALAVIVGAVGYRVFSRQNRYEQSALPQSQRIVARDTYETARSYLQNQSVCAIRESKWFGSCYFDVRRLPESATTCMPTSATVIFGRWYLVLLALSYSVMLRSTAALAVAAFAALVMAYANHWRRWSSNGNGYVY